MQIRRTAPRSLLAATLALSLVGGLLAGGLLAAVASAGPAGAAVLATCGADGTPAVIARHNPRFYVDTSLTPALRASYAGYEVRAGGVSRTGLWLQVGDFTGGVIDVAPGQPTAQALPSLASGGASTQYLLMQASGLTTLPQSHSVTVWQGRPGTGVPLCRRSGTYTGVHDTIKALANKVTGISADGPSEAASIGDAVTVTVTGNTGTLGAGPAEDPGVLDYTPNALVGFPAGAWRLERTELEIAPPTGGPATTHVDRLYLTGASGAARAYTARYVYRATGPAPTATAIRPIQYIASGTQVKHTDVGGTTLYSLPQVSPVATVTVSKRLTAPLDAVLPAGGGAASYEVVLRNDSDTARVADAVTDVLPSGSSYVPGSLRQDGRTVSDPVVSGGVLTIDGPVRVPAAGATTFSYDLALDGSSGVRRNAVSADYGTVVLDASADVTVDTPGVADVRVLGAGGPALAADTATTPAPGAAVRIPVLDNDSTDSGRALTLTATSTPTNGSVVAGADGVLTYTPTAGWSGRDSFTYTATDGVSGSSTATVTVDAVPGANPDVASTAVGVAVSGAVRANDVCGPTCTATVVIGPASAGVAGGSVAMAQDGTYTYTPTGVAAGTTVTFTYRLSDPTTGLVSSAVVSVDVGDLGADAATVGYGTTLRLDVLANDSACKANGACKAQRSVDPARGTATYPSGGSTNPFVDYTPGTGLWGLDALRYTTSGNGPTAPVTLLVAPPSQAVTTPSGQALEVAVPAGYACSTCAFSLGSPPAKGSATVDAGTGALSYVPAAGATGADSLTYRLTHPSTGLAVTGAVSITLGPAAADDTGTGLLGSALSVDTAVNDTCAATCTRTLTSGPTGLTMDADGRVSWTPDVLGTSTATYTVTSSTSGPASAQATVTLTVEGVQDDAADTGAGQAVTVDVRANDPCTSCTFVNATAPTAGNVTAQSDGTLRYTPDAGFSGVDGFSYTLASGPATTTASVTVVVRPQATDDAADTVVGRPLELRVLDNDVCSGCRVTAVTQPGSGTTTVLGAGDRVGFVPAQGAAGTEVFRYMITDARGGTSSAAVTVRVAAAPVLVDDSAGTDAGVAVQLDVLANDSCAGCVLDVESDPASGSVSIGAYGGLRYAPAPGASGRATFGYRATDPDTGGSATALVTVDVRPVAVDDDVWTAVGRTVDVDVLGNDACTDCSVEVMDVTPDATVSIVEGRVRVLPLPGLTGRVTVDYRVTDPVTSLQAGATLTVDVNDARPDSASTPAGQSVTVDVVANDVCDGCVVTAVSAPATFDGPAVTLVPGADTAGLVVLTYTAGIADGATVTGVLRVLVAPPLRTSPVLAGQPLVGSVHDATADPLTPATDCATCVVDLVRPPVVGEIELLPDGSLTYWPADGWEGTESFTYALTDPVSGASVEAAHHVSVGVRGPSLALTTTAGAVDATVAAPADRHDAGDTALLQHVVRNTGGEPLTDVHVTASRGGAVSCPEPALAVAAELTCSSTITLTQADLDAGQATVTTTAYGTAGSTAVSAPGAATVSLVPVSGLTATVDVALRLDVVAPALTADAGDEVTVTWRIENTGSTTLSGLTADGAACAPTTIGPGDSAACRRTVQLDDTDLAAGQLALPGVLVATAPTGPVSTTVPATATLPVTPEPEPEPEPEPQPGPLPAPAPAPPADAPSAPAPPADATRTGSGVSTDPAGAAEATAGALTATAGGIGAITVSEVPRRTALPAPGGGAGSYFSIDVDSATAGGEGFQRVELRLADPAAASLFWWDGGAWRKLPGTTRDSLTGALVVVLDGTTTPGVALDGLQLAVGATPVTRLAGPDRVATAVAASRAHYAEAGSATSVVLARSDVFADALTGGPLAVHEDAPVLLSSPASLDPSVAAEIARVLRRGGTVHLLGGTSALSAEVAQAVEALDRRVVRIGGQDRYQTAVLIAQALGDPAVVFEATGLDFPDAVAAGSAAVAAGGAVLLTAGPEQSAATAAYLDRHDPQRFAVGGAAADADPAAIALVGADRYDTAVLVADRFFPAPSGVGIAVGSAFPDPLVAAPFLARQGHPLLLVDGRNGPGAETARYLQQHSSGIAQITVFGGASAVRDSSVRDVQLALP